MASRITYSNGLETPHLEEIKRVVCDGESSAPATVISGVTQGTVLGPLIFLLSEIDFVE